MYVFIEYSPKTNWHVMNFEYATYVVSTIFTTTMHYDLNVAEIYKLYSITHTKK